MTRSGWLGGAGVALDRTDVPRVVTAAAVALLVTGAAGWVAGTDGNYAALIATYPTFLLPFATWVWFAEEGPVFLEQAETLIRLAGELPFEVDLWRAQNTFYRAVHLTYPELVERAAAGDQLAEVWVQHFRRLGDALGVAVEEAGTGE